MLVHGHCHHKAVFGGPTSEIALLRRAGANVEQIKAGNMYAAIGQDPYGQSYDTIVWLYNALVDQQKPSPDYFIPTAAVVGTQDNITTVSAAN